jgi:hypothetical protein
MSKKSILLHAKDGRFQSCQIFNDQYQAHAELEKILPDIKAAMAPDSQSTINLRSIVFGHAHFYNVGGHELTWDYETTYLNNEKWGLVAYDFDRFHMPKFFQTKGQAQEELGKVFGDKILAFPDDDISYSGINKSSAYLIINNQYGVPENCFWKIFKL